MQTKYTTLQKFKATLFFIIIAVVHSIYSNEVLQVKFPENENCVAYKTNKSMIFQDSVDVVGSNCQISISKIKTNGKLMIKVSIPLLSFNSNSKGRDGFVRKYLKEEINPTIEFTSVELANEELNDFVNQHDKSRNLVLNGKLTIGNESFPVRFTLQKKSSGLTGMMVTSFSYFNLKPPVAGPFGSVARVKDYLELHLQVKYDSLK